MIDDRVIDVSGTSYTVLSNGSSRSRPILSSVRKINPTSVEPSGVNQPIDVTIASGSSRQ